MSTELTADGWAYPMPDDGLQSKHPYVWMARAKEIARERDEAITQLNNLRTACPELTADGKAIRAYNEAHAHPTYADYVYLDRARAAVAEERRKREAADARAERAERQLLQELKTRTERPDFKTYADLKHGTAGAILWALQNGEISRGKAAEALAEWAHGVDPQLPKLPDAIPDDVTPLDLMRERDEARAELASVRAEAATRQERLSMALLAAEAETQRLREALKKIRLTPTRPFPDPYAHSQRVFSESVYSAWHYIQEIADSALAQSAQPAVVVQTPDKTVFITPPAEPEPEVLDPELREPLEPTVGLDWQRPCIQVDTVNARIEAIGKEIDRLQAQVADYCARYEKLEVETTAAQWQMAEKLAGEPARTRAAVVEQLRKLFLPESWDAGTIRAYIQQTADKLEREGAKEGGK